MFYFFLVKALEMYNSYFDCSCSPFENTLDQQFLFLSESHEEVIAALLHFVKEKKSFALACGDVETSAPRKCPPDAEDAEKSDGRQGIGRRGNAAKVLSPRSPLRACGEQGWSNSQIINAQASVPWPRRPYPVHPGRALRRS